MIVDTTVLIDFLRGNEDAMVALKKYQGALHTTIINKYELMVGIYKRFGASSDERIRSMDSFFSRFVILQLDEKALVKAARITATLLHQGKQIDDNDSYIVGIALTNGIDKILTKNVSHFERIPGLKVLTY